MTVWTVDYGNGPRPIKVPHAWCQDVPVNWEGSAVYKSSVNPTQIDEWLVFDGVSYRAEVFLDGALVCDHDGMWDAFAIPLSDYIGSVTDLEVRVTKNGGESFPVRDVLSGFLPYVYHTFGGIYGDVRVVRSNTDPTLGGERQDPHRVEMNGSQITIDKQFAYIRGVLSWGWYPELGHTNPSDETIREEVRLAKSMGFNTIKFCLWVPRHRYLEILEEEGMFAWLELPLWDPSGDEEKLGLMAQELHRIVRQYRHHRSIVTWTVGCELSASTPHEFRKRMVEIVQEETGCRLVKDNSGGSEMYGGDLREYGTFEDFHPYCDTHFYPQVLDSLIVGPRHSGPILLGEFNDFDVHRNLRELRDRAPFWTSDDPVLNDKGVRWQHDLPTVLRQSRWTSIDNLRLVKSSVSKGAWVRRRVMEHVRSQCDIAGYVVTGWRHTPISSSGMVDDDLQPVFSNIDEWNGDSMLFLIPVRRPPWVGGGNRPGWLDPQCFFEGQAFIRIGVHEKQFRDDRLQWSINSESGKGDLTEVFMYKAREVGTVSIDLPEGEHTLSAEFAQTKALWPVWVVPTPDWSSCKDWKKVDPQGVFDDVQLSQGSNVLTTSLDDRAINMANAGATIVAVIDREGTVPMPFWRECAFEFSSGLLDQFNDQWDRLWGIATDRALDTVWLSEKLGEYQVLMNRVDTRTYREDPYVVTARVGQGRVLVTTLRPQGGQGAQPHGVSKNPSGATLLHVFLTKRW